jgi:predicted RNA binding protein YcfA (HicA-like mRNA interferase family)
MRRAVKFREFIAIIEPHGFVLDRQRGSHRVYKGNVGGQTRMIVVAAHGEGGDIRPGTLASMIRQSGLPRDVFR